jgi:hypothetical protein
MREIRTSGLMSGDGKRSIATAPVLDSTTLFGYRCADAVRAGDLSVRPTTMAAISDVYLAVP